MLDPRLKDWMSLGYAKIGDISYSIALNMRKGKNSTPTQRALYEQGIKIYLILDVLFRHVTFDDITGEPELWRITEEQVNKFTRCLIEIGELDKLPAAPALYPTSTPIRILQGVQGPQGPPGQAGSDADIVATLKTGERRLRLVESVVGGVKTYEFSYSEYIAQALSAAVQGTSIWEIGDIVDFTILITSTKGSEALVSIVCDDPTADGILQGLLNLVSANDANAQPYQVTIPLLDQAGSQSFLFTSTDEETKTKVASASISFYYPYLYGDSDLNTINPYTSLTKILAGKANRSIVFNDTDKYFWIWYPSSYGTLSSIKDQNGFDVTSSFTTGTEDVTSTGKDANWTHNYRWYRTTVKTTINATYSIQF